jgi:hypothetical protein
MPGKKGKQQAAAYSVTNQPIAAILAHHEIPADSRCLIRKYLEAIAQLRLSNGAPLVSVVLFGSAAKGAFRPCFTDWARGGPGPRFTTCCGVRRFWWRRRNCWRGRCGSGTPALLQVGASRRRGGMAPGLFVLDADAADGAPDVLDGAGREHTRQWLLVLRSPEPQVKPASDYGASGRHE